MQFIVVGLIIQIFFINVSNFFLLFNLYVDISKDEHSLSIMLSNAEIHEQIYDYAIEFSQNIKQMSNLVKEKQMVIFMFFSFLIHFF